MNMGQIVARCRRLVARASGRRGQAGEPLVRPTEPPHYHTMRDGDGHLIWEGAYDLYPLWSAFGIPDDLRGQTVIDVGSASGFFAFECEKRGAGPVIATELASVAERDVKANRQAFPRQQLTATPEKSQSDIRELIAMLGSQVQLRVGNINEPLHDTLGQYDWVIFGSLLTVLRNPILALEHVRALTRGRAVVIASYLPHESRAVLSWVQSDRPFDWWLPSKSLVPDMLRAVGFGRVEEVRDFVLRHRNGDEQHQACWHAFP